METFIKYLKEYYDFFSPGEVFHIDAFQDPRTPGLLVRIRRECEDSFANKKPLFITVPYHKFIEGNNDKLCSFVADELRSFNLDKCIQVIKEAVNAC